VKIIKKVRVSGKSIRQGIPEDCNLCPVALAVTKALNLTEGQTVEVDGKEIVIVGPSGVCTSGPWLFVGKAPRQVERFVKKFDRTISSFNRKSTKRADLEPFTFILRLESTNQ
jgi:hypothetical protein